MITASLEKLRQAVSKPAHAYRVTSQTFPDLDVQRLVREMSLDDFGKARGQNEEPASDGASYDAVETEIIETVGAAQKAAHDELENHLSGFRQRLVDLDFKTQFSSIISFGHSGLNDLKQELQTAIDELHPPRRDLAEAESWHIKFRKDHQLVRPSVIETPRHSFIKWATVIVLIILELIANGHFLSAGSEFGLVGGILEALLFAALNVVVALLFGLIAIPYLTHRNLFLKLLGLVGFVAYLAWMIGLNLGLAHYREVAEGVLEGGGRLVIQRLQTAPLQLEDFESWLLFALGCVFSLLAMIDGLKWKDTYPGYAAVDKQFRTARQKYIDMRADSIARLGDIRKEHEEILTDVRADLGKHLSEHEGIIGHRARLLQLFEEHQTQLEKAANSLLRTYRDANEAARTTPKPSRFSEPYVLQKVTVSIAREGEWNSAELKEEIRSAQEKVDQIFVDLGKQFDEALERYRELDKLVPEA